MHVCLRGRERQIVCVRSVYVSRPQVSGGRVRVLRGLQRGPPTLSICFRGREQAEQRRRGWRGLATHTLRGGGAVADKQVPVLTVTLHT